MSQITKADADHGNVDGVESGNFVPYEAPYHHYEDNVPGGYFVNFHEGHTIEKHFAFLGVKFDISASSSGYTVTGMSDELFRKVRTDPGVKSIEDDTYGEGL